MASDQILVSVVIPTFNRPDAAVRCARSALSSRFAGGIEAIIVDDCSTKCRVADVVSAELGEDSRVRVIRHDVNKRVAAARNTGGRAARGTYILFVDDDNELAPEAIARLVAVLEQGEYSIVAPLAVNVSPTGEKTVWARSFAFSPWTSIPRNVDADVPYTADYQKGIAGQVIDTWYSPNAYMLPRELFNQSGGFYEWFGIYMEESDLCMRIRKNGHKVGVVGDAVTWHRHYNDTGDAVMRRFAMNMPWKAYLLSRNRLHFACLHYSFVQVLSIAFVFAPLISFRYFVFSLRHGYPRIAGAFLKGYAVGLVQIIKKVITHEYTFR